MADFAIYHWAPTERRNRILHDGLKPGSWSRDRLWRPPFICFALDPLTGWRLSGGLDRDNTIGSWDLWQGWTGDVDGYEEIHYDNGAVKEIRIYQRIWKRDLWLVATRVTNA